MKKIIASITLGILATVFSLYAWSEHGELSMAQVVVGIFMYMLMFPAALYLLMNEIDKIITAVKEYRKTLKA